MFQTSKTELKKLCSGILNKYQVDESLGYTKITNIGEHEFLMMVFENHIDWEQKKGVGVDFISIILTEWRTKCFQLHRIDGTTTDISFRSAIEHKSPRRIFAEACRNAVRKEIERFRNENVIYGVTTCEITGETLTRNNTHIDHYDLKFAELVASFYKKHLSHYSIEQIVDKWINKTEDNSCDTFFTARYNVDKVTEKITLTNNDWDSHLSSLFYWFHNSNTHLRAVSKQANLSILK